MKSYYLWIVLIFSIFVISLLFGIHVSTTYDVSSEISEFLGYYFSIQKVIDSDPNETITNSKTIFLDAKSMLQSNFSLDHRLLLIPSEEGIISQFLRVVGFLEQANRYKRSLLLFPFTSHHYADIEAVYQSNCGRISLCDVFRFPSTVECLKFNYLRNNGELECSISNILQQFNCVHFHFNDWMMDHPEHFGLESYNEINMNMTSTFDWMTSKCVVLGVQGGPKYLKETPIEFSLEYLELYNAALNKLKKVYSSIYSSSIHEFFNEDNTQKSESLVVNNTVLLIVIHWRRGDQISSSLRCKSGENAIFSCKSANNSRSFVVYRDD